MENKFNKEDKAKLIEFLNIIAKHARFDVDTQQLIKYFKLLSFMQTELIPKIESNILEVIKVIEEENKE